ncbi:S24 family peptidase [Vibrio rotiferianus]|uniref:S24 family peptidase n=1 Tax=Vibrio rotiferianus TaxID=190895 RepID=UPI003396AC93
MKEYFLSTELVGLEGMPNSASGVAQKGRRNNWLYRNTAGSKKVLEYHISNFHPDVKKQLIEKYVTDPEEAKLLMALTEPTMEVGIDSGPLAAMVIKSSPSPDAYLQRVGRAARTSEDSETEKGGNITELSNVKKVKSPSQIGNMCAVPVYNVYASCGFGSLSDTEYQIRTEFLPCEWLKRFGLTEENARIIECHGDSMEDTLSDGDEVLVDTRELDHPVKHGVYVVRIGKHVYIKRLRYDIMAEGYEVISDNIELYPSFIVNGDKLQEFRVIGKVVTTVMKAVV